MRTRLGNYILALGVLVLPACSASVGDESSVKVNVQTPKVGAQGQGAGVGQGPAVTPNSQKYKDLGKQPATGRSGTATNASVTGRKVSSGWVVVRLLMAHSRHSLGFARDPRARLLPRSRPRCRRLL